MSEQAKAMKEENLRKDKEIAQLQEEATIRQNQLKKVRRNVNVVLRKIVREVSCFQILFLMHKVLTKRSNIVCQTFHICFSSNV